ncbi:N-6 DNA methylase [Pusillimonas sp. CC-YST705]|uniref:site-specific DNA-methyltransferase (adenine-specific) n=1 Tax=Mesopusillimonas faecipullorum TaxID=2755040 RepID=A0ABS8C9G6_9BURK|nr:N-6 DNA methylase [Mesopusillimonas faecipullorum]MCB5362670.1 N-6 DNA methylase [Mesopusillimonas faecipullorum]
MTLPNDSLRPLPPTGRFRALDADKLRGGYYTPEVLAEWLCAWAIRSPSERVLEPSCGDGAFLAAAARRLTALGARPGAKTQLQGVEIVPDQAALASERLAREGAGLGRVHVGDFFAWWTQTQSEQVDTVVGNPPFIRHQSFPEPAREFAMAAMATLGLKPSRMANIWVPFVAACVARLAPGGRLAMVLPAELLQVAYAAQLRGFLAQSFHRIDLVACTELFFENVQQEVVLLLAEGKSLSPVQECQVRMHEVQTAAELVGKRPEALMLAQAPKLVQHDSEKWLKYFLSNAEMGLMRALREAGGVAPLSAHASVDVGVVTGFNDFFVLDNTAVQAHDLSAWAEPVVSRAAQLKGAVFTSQDWQELSNKPAQRVHLLRLQPDTLVPSGSGLQAYLQGGEVAGIHRGHKCSIRKPWYAVPYVWAPDVFLFRQIYAFPAAVLNAANAAVTDTLHRLRVHTAKPEQLLPSFYTYLTAASAEIEGRSYGGGVLELGPTEAERLLMPASLQSGLPLSEIDAMIRKGKLDEILAENSQLILQAGLGLSTAECRMLRGIWERMRDRRMARRKQRRSSLSGATA